MKSGPEGPLTSFIIAIGSDFSVLQPVDIRSIAVLRHHERIIAVRLRSTAAALISTERPSVFP